MLSLFDTAKRILKYFFAERHLAYGTQSVGENNLFSIDNILSNTP